MGSGQSKPLSQWSAQNVADGVTSLGKRYEDYAEEVVENGVDGTLLASLSEEEFQETLEDLHVTNRLHQRKLKSEFLRLVQIQCSNSQDDPVSSSPKQGDEHERPKEEKYPSKRGQRRGSSLIEAAEAYHLLPEDVEQKEAEDDLRPFDEVAARLFRQLESSTDENSLAKYVGIHLFHGEGGHVSLGSRFIDPATHKLENKRLHKENKSLCYKLFADTGKDRDISREDFKIYELPPGEHELQEPGKPSLYAGHVITNSDGECIGVVCSLMDIVDHDTSSLSSATEEHDREQQRAKKELLQQMAQESERLLEARSVLLERQKLVRRQVQGLTNSAPKVTAEEATKNDATTASTDNHHPKLRPISDQQIALHEKEAGLINSTVEVKHHRPRTLHHSLVKKMRANEAELEEQGHLPPDFWKANDDVGVDRAPIPKNDLERVAALENLGIKDLTPDDPTYRSLKGLVELGAKLLGFKIGLLTYLDHEGAFGTCSYTPEDVPAETMNFLVTTYQPYKFDPNTGIPYCFRGPRCVAQCNVPTTTGKTFLIPDLWADESYPHSSLIPGSVRSYIGTPIRWRGLPVATLCLLDPEPRHNIGAVQELQLEQVADLMSQQIENFSIQKETERLEEERKRLQITQASRNQSANTTPPEGSAALVFTDIQGSTRLWEANPAAMHKALQVHDAIMRKYLTANYGFEITTEGDAFQIAFHDSIDAIRFSLAVQEDLQKADWSKEFLSLPDGRDDGCGFRGARVRMAIHCGEVLHRDNAVSGRKEYVGDTVHITKALEDMAHGGQILVTSDVWNAVCYVAETTLGAPQVVDLGEHVVRRGKHQYEGVTSMGVVQVVPSTVAYDFFTHRAANATVDSTAKHGRLFPPPETKKQMSPSFFDAPYLNNQVTMLFVYTSEIEKHYDDPASILAVLAQQARHLVGNGPGYQCKSWMFAFPSPIDAVEYGNRLQKSLRGHLIHGSDLGGMIKIGIFEGQFTSMGPHPTTGRADYFGKVVNRAARVAGAATPGDVCLGRLDTESPQLLCTGSGQVNCTFLRSKLLSGMDEEMNLFSCLID